MRLPAGTGTRRRGAGDAGAGEEAVAVAARRAASARPACATAARSASRATAPRRCAACGRRSGTSSGRRRWWPRRSRRRCRRGTAPRRAPARRRSRHLRADFDLAAASAACSAVLKPPLPSGGRPVRRASATRSRGPTLACRLRPRRHLPAQAQHRVGVAEVAASRVVAVGTGSCRARSSLTLARCARRPLAANDGAERRFGLHIQNRACVALLFSSRRSAPITPSVWRGRRCR